MEYSNYQMTTFIQNAWTRDSRTNAKFLVQHSRGF